MRWWPLLVAGCASQSALERQVEAGMRSHPERAWGSEVTLRCDPADAEVWLDGIPRGTCLDYSGDPRGLKLGDGMHQVEVKKSGFWPYQTSLDSSGTRAALNVTLLPSH